MDPLSLTMSGLILGMIALQLYRRTKVLIKAKSTMVEKTSLGVSAVMIAVVTVFGSSRPIHYLVGALLAVLVYASYSKTGITTTGLNAMNRILMPMPWSGLRFAKLVKQVNGQEFVLHTVGRMWTNVMTFDMKDFDQTLAILKKHLNNDQYEISNETLVEGLREAQRKGKANSQANSNTKGQ